MAVVEIDRISYQGFVVEAVAVDRINYQQEASGSAVGVVDRIRCQSDFGSEVDRTDYQKVEVEVEVDRINCLKGESFADLVAVCSGQKCQRYFAAVVAVGFDFDLTGVH